MKKYTWMILPLILCLCGPVSAEYYKFTDENGNVRFTDDLSKVPENQRPDVTSYDEFQSTTPSIYEQSKTSTEDNNASAPNTETSASKGAQNKQILKKKDELDNAHKALLEQKASIEAEENTEKAKWEPQKIKQKKRELNKKIYEYEQKRKALNAEIEKYNTGRAEQIDKNKK